MAEVTQAIRNCFAEVSYQMSLPDTTIVLIPEPIMREMQDFNLAVEKADAVQEQELIRGLSSTAYGIVAARGLPGNWVLCSQERIDQIIGFNVAQGISLELTSIIPVSDLLGKLIQARKIAEE